MVAKGQNTTFEGSLADLSVVDLLQALRIAQKTGLLVLRGAGVAAALSFEEGRVVSCRHPEPGVHIGKLLVERGAVGLAEVEQGLRRQETAGMARRPLVSTLVEMGLLDQETGWQALQELVDMTVSEVQAWRAGTFAFDRQEPACIDGFRHSPAAAGPELAEDTQGMLTEALHILDEHGGSASDEGLADEAAAPASAPWQVLALCRDDDWRAALHAGERLERFALFVSADVDELSARLAECRKQGVLPALLVDLGAPDDSRWQQTSRALLPAVLRRYPEVPVVALCEAGPQACAEAFRLGASATVERPAPARGGQASRLPGAWQPVHDALLTQLQRSAAAAEDLRRLAGEMTALRDCVREIRFPHRPTDVSLTVMRHLAELVERCILFLVREHDLLALGAFGLDHVPEAAAVLSRLKLRLDRGSLLDAVAGTGTIHFGPSPDASFPARLHEVIGRPVSPDIILLPLRTRERSAALIYGDFGHEESRTLDTVALQIAAEFAGMAFDLALHERTSPPSPSVPRPAPAPPREPPPPLPRPHYDDAELPVPVQRKRGRHHRHIP